MIGRLCGLQPLRPRNGAGPSPITARSATCCASDPPRMPAGRCEITFDDATKSLRVMPSWSPVNRARLILMQDLMQDMSRRRLILATAPSSRAQRCWVAKSRSRKRANSSGGVGSVAAPSVVNSSRKFGRASASLTPSYRARHRPPSAYRAAPTGQYSRTPRNPENRTPPWSAPRAAQEYVPGRSRQGP